MVRRRELLLALTALSWSGAATAQSTSGRAPAAIAGCYELRHGVWSRSLGANAKYHELPTRIHLDTTPGPRGRGWTLSPDIAFPQPHRFPAPSWSMKGDTIELIWSNGFQPTRIRAVRQRNGELVGEAVVSSDANEYGTDLPKANAAARRVACPTG